MRDYFDLRPGEREIREQRWAEFDGACSVSPSWQQVYCQELKWAAGLKEDAVPAAMRAALLTRDALWERTEPDIYQHWKARVEEGLQDGVNLECRRGILRGVLCARQAFFASLRQCTYYRGKVLGLSVGALLLGVMSLLGLLRWIRLHPEAGELGSAVLALAAGWTGGAFTWLLANRSAVATSTFAELREMSRWLYTISRATIGAVSALILFIAMLAGAIQNPAEKLLRTEVGEAELARATGVFRTVVAETELEGGAEQDIAKAVGAFSQLARSFYQTGDGKEPMNAWPDRKWMERSGLKVKVAPDPKETSRIHDAFQRESNSLWMLVFLCIVGGFSETLVPKILNTKSGNLDGRRA